MRVSVVDDHVEVREASPEDDRRQVVQRDICRRLVARFGGRAPADLVHRLVEEAFDSFRGAKVTQYVPILVERAVTDGLRRRFTTPRP